MVKARSVVVPLALVGCAPLAAQGRPAPADSFNAYILKAVEAVKARQAASAEPLSGYDIRQAYTRPIPYAGGTIPASDPPYTMCVAGIAEVILTALAIYGDEHPGFDPSGTLPLVGWRRMRPRDIRAHLWVDPALGAHGTADALETFGIGRKVPFRELTPGSFVNLNRPPGASGKPTGHAVVFLGFIDADGGLLEEYDPALVAGFRYFGANGRGRTLFPAGGFFERPAFFIAKDGSRPCPAIDGERPDCRIERQSSQRMLNTGYMLSPDAWRPERQEQNLDRIVKRMYGARAAMVGALGVDPDVTLDEFRLKLDETDTMRLNPVFEAEE